MSDESQQRATQDVGALEEVETVKVSDAAMKRALAKEAEELKAKSIEESLAAREEAMATAAMSDYELKKAIAASERDEESQEPRKARNAEMVAPLTGFDPGAFSKEAADQIVRIEGGERLEARPTKELAPPPPEPAAPVAKETSSRRIGRVIIAVLALLAALGVVFIFKP